MISDHEFSISGTPPELVEAVNIASLEVLPKKSTEKYEYTYKRFMDYRKNKNTSTFSKNIMEYFLDLCLKMKSTLAIKNNVDISTYSKFRSLLKREAQGYRAKKYKILTKEEIEKFIQEAPGGLIFGISGACRMDELVRMSVQDLESKLLISIPDSKTNKPK